jgi:cysteine desulfurase
MPKVYLDNCLTTKPDPKVIEAMMPYLTEKFYFPGNFVSTGSNAKKDIANFKKIIAESLNANPDEIHHTSSGTTANNIAIKGYILANAEKGNHIICSEIDYPDILTNAAFFEENGFEVTYISADHDGFINLEELKNAITKDTILVMTTLANHVLGTIQPVKKIKEIIQEQNNQTALFIDAAHAYGRLKIDVKDLNCDLLTFSGHKIHAPQGTGALYVKKGIHLNQYKHGINRMDDLDTGCISMAGLAGLAKAVEIQFSNLENTIEYIRNLQNYLLQGLEKKLGKLFINGPIGNDRICHNLNISMTDIEGEGLMLMLDIAGITVATGSACASQGLKPNYILMATGRTFVQSHGSIKFTLSRMNTFEELDYVIEKFTESVEKLRKLSPR